MSDPRADDPFAAPDERTFMMPTPGARGRGPAPGGAPPAAMAGGRPQPEVARDLPPPETGMNPLLALANPLLCTAPRLRATAHVADPQALKDALAQTIREFEQRARAQGLAPERVLAARYVLCTVLDEAAAGTPWGNGGTWGRNNLLVTFHNEGFGGDKVFQLMAKLAEDPRTNRDLLELIYAALTLGFEGRYRILEGGAAQLAAVRERLAQILKTARGDHAAALAQHWPVQPRRARPLLSWLPLWVTGAVTALALLGLYLALLFGLGAASDPVFARIVALRPPAPAPTQVVVPAPAAPRLAPLLQADIQAGLIAVRDEADRSVVVMRGEGLFESGSATLGADREPLIRRIAQAMAQVPGPVVVTGHTDNVQSRSLRFPSNWHLSEARAASVRELMVGAGLPAGRIEARGKGEAEPVAPNDSPAQRARNRRVEVELRVAAAAAPAPAAPAAPASGSTAP